jgi:hypothetical protein
MCLLVKWSSDKKRTIEAAQEEQEQGEGEGEAEVVEVGEDDERGESEDGEVVIGTTRLPEQQAQPNALASNALIEKVSHNRTMEQKGM